jgi:tetratricopeptide (TPR) repeat protein
MTIEEEIEQVDFKDPNQVITFYESNKLYFDNYQRLENQNRISEFIDIKLHYCNSLTDKQHLEKLLRIIPEINELLTKLPKEHWNYIQSERHSKFLNAMALSNQKKFKKSFPIFQRLVKEDPNHHHYKVWHDHAKLGMFQWLFNLGSITGVSLVFLYIILSENEILLPFDIGNVGIAILGISFFSQLGMKEYFKRKKTKPNNHK